MSPISSVILLGIFIIANSEDIFEKLHQHDYKLEYTRAEVFSYSKSVQKYVTAHTFKYNRTYTATNISFEYTIDTNEDTDIILQVYKLASNEYRTFPIRYRVNFCLVLKKNSFGMGSSIKTETGVPLCPMKKDVKYYSSNFNPDESLFPPLMPIGEYKLEVTFMYKELDIGVQNYYGRIYRPIKIPK